MGVRPQTEPADVLLSKLDEIPALPRIVLRVNEMLQDGKSSMRETAAVLKQDPALCAKVLKLANSSYYAIPGGVSDVERALSFLGLHTISQLVLGISVFAAFPSTGTEGNFRIPEFWRFSLGVAIGCEILAKKSGYSRPQEAFTAGLLHGIGKLALQRIEPLTFQDILTATQVNQTSFLSEEVKRGLPGYAVLGHALASRWGLPEVLREAIRSHMDPAVVAGSLASFIKVSRMYCMKFKVGVSGDWVAPSTATLSEASQEASKAFEKELQIGMDKAGAMLNAYA